MRHRLALLAGAALAVPAVPLVAAAPAQAADTVICVPVVVAGCTQPAATLAAAISAASTNGVSYTIRLAAASYSGIFQIDGTNHPITLQGSGQGTTVLTAPASATNQIYLGATQATVRDLTISMAGANSANDTGLSLSHATVDHVSVDGAATTNAIGIQAGTSSISHSISAMPFTAGAGTRGLYSSGGNTITDSTLSGSQGLNLSDPGTIDVVSRTAIRADSDGVVTDGGRVDIDDSVIDLGVSTGVGLAAVNFNGSPTPMAINANHLTIVGGGANSKGAWAYAASPGAKQTSTLTLTNSVVRGPATSLVADADNDGSQSGASTATVSVSHSDYQTTGGVIGAHGAGGVVPGAGNLVGADPGFANAPAGDYHLTVGSPVVDKGDPATGGPATDRDGAPRVVDGDAVPGAVRDMGAYELPDSVRPDTSISGGPTGLTNDPTPTFTLVSVPGATFQCKVDATAYTPCTTPFTAPTLSDGPHSISVVSKDLGNNIDLSPATRAFTVDTVAPNTTISTKPPKRTTKAKVKLVFTSEAGATFECQVDGKAWHPCTSPDKIKVKRGKHVVLVRAVDAAGNADATPAKARFKRVPKAH